MNNLMLDTYCFFLWAYDLIASLLHESQIIIWNRFIKLHWGRLYIREDESHYSLKMDIDAYLGMSQKKKDEYIADLIRRKKIVRERAISRNRF